MTRRRLLGGGVLLALCMACALPLYRYLAGQELSFRLLSERYELLAPEMLAILCFLPLLFWAASGSLADLPMVQRSLSLLARAGLLLLLALSLARFSQTTDATRISCVFLIDVSESMTDRSIAEAQRWLNQALAERGDSDVHLITFANRPKQLPLPENDEGRIALTRHPAAKRSSDKGAPQTDLQSALQLAYALFPPGHLRRVVVLSDGHETTGDALQESARAAHFGVRVFYRAPNTQGPREVAVRGLELPSPIGVGESFEVRANVYSTHTTSARARLYQGEVLNGLDGVRDVELSKGDNEIVFRSVVRTSGTVPYRLELTPREGDRFEDNNSAAALAVVPGRPTVLVVERVPEHIRHLANALHAADYEVEVRSAASMPRSLPELQRHDFVILSDVPAERISLSQMDLLERYVRDLGGGLMVAGGEQSFGLGGYQGTRLEQLLPVRMTSERRRDEHSLALALVIDTSGSMSGQKIELAKEAARATAELLGADDSLAVIGFSGEPERKVRMQSARNRMRIGQNIGRLTAQGGTAIFPALDMAFQDLLSTRARVKHVILLTDGQTQESGITELVQAMRAELITVSTVGLGSDVNRSLLQKAANLGGGRAYFTNDPNNIPRIFMRETTTVGKNNAVEDLVQATIAEPADFLKGIDLRRAPYLRGYVATSGKPRPAQVILRSDLGEPLLARWRVGLGWSLAWTSDLHARWAADWLRWDRFPVFLGQLVREHMRQERSDELPMRVRVEGARALVTVDALGKDDRFINDLESEAVVEGPVGGSSKARRTRLLQRAPGLYEGSVPIEGFGSFAVSGTHERDGRVVARSYGQLSRPYPREYDVTSHADDLLARVAATTGGARLTKLARVFEAGDERIRSERELWLPLTLLAVGVFLLDLALRRVRFFSRG